MLEEQHLWSHVWKKIVSRLKCYLFFLLIFFNSNAQFWLQQHRFCGKLKLLIASAKFGVGGGLEVEGEGCYSKHTFFFS